MLRTIQSRLRAGVARAARAATTTTTTGDATADAPRVPTDRDVSRSPAGGDTGPGGIADDEATRQFFQHLGMDAWCPGCGDAISRVDRHVETRLGVDTTVCPDCCTCDH